MGIEMMSDMAAIDRWKRTMKPGTTWTSNIPMPPHFHFVDAWPAEIMQKSGHQKCSEYTPIDPWGQRHRGK